MDGLSPPLSFFILVYRSYHASADLRPDIYYFPFFVVSDRQLFHGRNDHADDSSSSSLGIQRISKGDKSVEAAPNVPHILNHSLHHMISSLGKSWMTVP